MVTNFKKRRPGRPMGFALDDALDRAVDMFWEHGYEGVDVERIAAAVNVTKPALYRAFGDKSTLLLKAVERYAVVHGGPIIAQFQAEPDIYKAVSILLENTVNLASGESRGGCMMVAAALGQSERVSEIRSFMAKGLTNAADIFAKRFEKEMETGRLRSTPSAYIRGRALVDIMKGLQLRAKAGIEREQLLQDAAGYVSLILGD